MLMMQLHKKLVRPHLEFCVCFDHPGNIPLCLIFFKKYDINQETRTKLLEDGGQAWDLFFKLRRPRGDLIDVSNDVRGMDQVNAHNRFVRPDFPHSEWSLYGMSWGKCLRQLLTKLKGHLDMYITGRVCIDYVLPGSKLTQSI